MIKAKKKKWEFVLEPSLGEKGRLTNKSKFKKENVTQSIQFSTTDYVHEASDLTYIHI